jgi:hypothetical protein
MFHNALLHLMRVAATKQTTFTISLKCCAPAFAAGHASQPNTPSDSISMKFSDGLRLSSERNQCHANQFSGFVSHSHWPDRRQRHAGR